MLCLSDVTSTTDENGAVLIEQQTGFKIADVLPNGYKAKEILPMWLLPFVKIFCLQRKIDHLSGSKKMRKKLEKVKKLVKHATVIEGEALQSTLDFYHTTDIDILENAYGDFVTTRQESRSLYYSHSRMKITRKYELQKQKQVDVMCMHYDMTSST
ncbi:hypothetical protein K501DRAFT_276401 [Backusella circina FSU 941]|nr:hypothetical protein K501DRAFT_276401 [Backusella circina FSU 941]